MLDIRFQLTASSFRMRSIVSTSFILTSQFRAFLEHLIDRVIIPIIDRIQILAGITIDLELLISV
jgi:hypothetical protein